MRAVRMLAIQTGVHLGASGPLIAEQLLIVLFSGQLIIHSCRPCRLDRGRTRRGSRTVALNDHGTRDCGAWAAAGLRWHRVARWLLPPAALHEYARRSGSRPLQVEFGRAYRGEEAGDCSTARE